MLNTSLGPLGLFAALVFVLPIVGHAAPLPDGLRIEGERWTYEGDGLALRGILLQPVGTGPFPAIVISHGLGGSAQSFGLNKARQFVRFGFVCIACDYTHAAGPQRSIQSTPAGRASFGASEENLRRATKCLDILASLPNVDAARLCAYGHSMGGFVTIALAAQLPDRLRAAAITGSGIAPREGFAAPSAAAAAAIRTPMLIIHGADDTTVRPEQSLALQTILERAGVAHERRVFEGIGHPVDQQAAVEVYGLIRDWFVLHEVLGPEAADVEITAANAAPLARPRGGAAPSQPGGTDEPEWVREPIAAPRATYERFRSAAIDADVSYLIYLPPSYEGQPDVRLPVIYWLHGIGGSQQGVPGIVQRFDEAIARGDLPPLLIVFVNGVRDSFYCDSADGRTAVETVIVQDLIPHIDRTYRTIAERGGRIIEGFSMGGFGAAHLAFKYPELFCGVSLLDAALVDVTAMQTRHAALYQRIFAASPARFDAEHPTTLLETHADALRGRTEIRLAVGALVGGNSRLHEQLTRLHIDHAYDELPVGHNQAAVYDALGERNWTFYRRALTTR